MHQRTKTLKEKEVVGSLRKYSRCDYARETECRMNSVSTEMPEIEMVMHVWEHPVPADQVVPERYDRERCEVMAMV